MITPETSKTYDYGTLDLTSKGAYSDIETWAEFEARRNLGASVITLAAAAAIGDFFLDTPMEEVFGQFALAITQVLKKQTWTSGSPSLMVRKLALMILEYEDGDPEPALEIKYRFKQSAGFFSTAEDTSQSDVIFMKISYSNHALKDMWAAVTPGYSVAYTGMILAMKKFLIAEVLPEIMEDKETVEALFKNSTIVLSEVGLPNAPYSYSNSKMEISKRISKKIQAMGLEENTMNPISSSGSRLIKLTPSQFHRIRTIPFGEGDDRELGWTDRVTMSDEQWTKYKTRTHVSDSQMGMSSEFSTSILENTWLGGKEPDSKDGPLRFINIPEFTLPDEYLDVAKGGDPSASSWLPQHEDLIKYLWGLGKFEETGDYTEYDYGTSSLDLVSWTQKWGSAWDFVQSFFQSPAERAWDLDYAHRVLFGSFVMNLLAYDRKRYDPEKQEVERWELTPSQIFWETYDTALPVNLKSNGVDTTADAGASSYIDSIMILILNNEEIERRIARWDFICESALNHPLDSSGALADLNDDDIVDVTDIALQDDFADGVVEAELTAFELGIPEAEPLTEEEIENRQKFFKQCALMINAHRLKHQLRRRHYSEYVRSKDNMYKPFEGRFWMASCESDQERLINNLISSEDGKEFFNIPPAILSYLTPKMRFYKIENNGKGVLSDTEFIFGQHVDLNRDKNYTRTETGQDSNVRVPSSYLAADFDKGSGCGVKEFSFSFEGATPATTRNDIKAKLVLYFQTFSDMLRERISYNGKTYRFIDLIIQPKPNDLGKINNVEIVHPNQYDPSFFRIRAEVGYNPLDEVAPIQFKGYTQEQWSRLNQAILRTNRAYYLCMVDHDLNINNDGTVSVVISYQAYVETAMKSLRHDALTTPDLVKARKKSQENLQKMLDNPDCTNDQIAQFQFLVSTGEEQIRKSSLRSILSRLLYRDKIYGLEIEKTDARYFRNHGYFSNCRLKSLYGDGIPDSFTSLNQLETVDPSSAGLALEDILEDGKYPENFDFADPDDLKINFFYFGDLLHTILDSMYDDDGQQVSTMENTKFLLGSLDFNAFIQRNNEKAVNSTINIAELPISVDYFMQWFTENILTQGETRKSFPVMYFVRNLANQLLKNSLLESCVHRKLETNLRFQTGQISAFSPDGRDPFGKLVNKSGWVVNTDRMRRSKDLPLLGDADQELRRLAGPGGLSPYFHNYLVVNVVGSSLTYTGLGRYKDDVESGRYHIDIGSNRGIVKTVKFAKTDIQYLREARFMRQGIDGLQQLANVYKANIEMYGNSLFYPGMELYINPYGIGGTEFGSPGQGPKSKGGRSLANTLGIGGYHTVVSVDSTIKPGSYSTSISAQWYYSGDGEGNPANSGARVTTEISSIDKPRDIWDGEDEKCKDIYLETNFMLENIIDNPSSFMDTSTSMIEDIPPSLLEETESSGVSAVGPELTLIASADDPSLDNVLRFLDDNGEEYLIPYSSIVEHNAGNTEEYYKDGSKTGVLSKGIDSDGNFYVELQVLVAPNNGKIVRSTEFLVTELKPGKRSDDRDAEEWVTNEDKNIDTGSVDENSPIPDDENTDPVDFDEELSRREQRQQRREERRAGENPEPSEAPEQQPMSDDTVRQEDISEGERNIDSNINITRLTRPLYVEDKEIPYGAVFEYIPESDTLLIWKTEEDFNKGIQGSDALVRNFTGERKFLMTKLSQDYEMLSVIREYLVNSGNSPTWNLPPRPMRSNDQMADIRHVVTGLMSEGAIPENYQNEPGLSFQVAFHITDPVKKEGLALNNAQNEYDIWAILPWLPGKGKYDPVISINIVDGKIMAVEYWMDIDNYAVSSEDMVGFNPDYRTPRMTGLDDSYASVWGLLRRHMTPENLVPGQSIPSILYP